MTPSLPTFFIALAMMSPIDESAFAEIAPTCAIALSSAVGSESSFRDSTARTTALSMPRLRSIGFIPAATDFRPSTSIDWANTVAVVVPSPAMSEVCDATSLTIWAPMFSNLSSSSILFGNRDAVLRDGRGTETLLEHDVAALRAKGNFHGVG